MPKPKARADADHRDPLAVADANRASIDPVMRVSESARDAALALAAMGGTAPDARRNKKTAWARARGRITGDHAAELGVDAELAADPEYLPARFPTAAEIIRQDRDGDHGRDPGAHLESLDAPPCAMCGGMGILTPCTSRIQRGERVLAVESKVWACPGSCVDPVTGRAWRWVDGPLWLWADDHADEQWSAAFGANMPPSPRFAHPQSGPKFITQGFADLAGQFDFDDPNYDFRAVRARGRVRGDDVEDPGPSADDVVNVLQKLAADDGVPAHRQRLVRALAAAIEAGDLANSTGHRTAVLVEHGPNPLFPDNDDGARRPA